jgi:adenosylhomocysteine nucleosidase
MFPQKVSITRKDATPDAEEERFWFQTDPTMLEVVRRVANDVRLDKCTSRGNCLADDPKIVVGGNGVSGPTFVDNAEYRDWVWETFQADALDMETAAVAHVAYANGVPFIAFRSLSDLAGGGPGENELSTFFQLAADNSAATVIGYLEEWAER